MSATKKILYISYDGLTDPLGQSQVLAYMEKLSSIYQVFIISCEKKDRFHKYAGEIKDRCREKGIIWHPLLYTKSPPVVSTIYDLWKLTNKAKELYKRYKYDILHCRSYLPSLIGLRLKKKYAVKFIFDMRGFWIDEKIEAGSWKTGNPVYKEVIKYFRKKEQQFYESADNIVTLTQAAKQVVVTMKPGLEKKIRVIPTCVNLDVFKPFQPAWREKIREQLGIPQDAFVLLYSGGYGANYDIGFLLEVYKKLKKRDPGTCLLILSKDGITGLESEHDNKDFFSVSLSYSEVGSFLMAGDLGVINYANRFSVSGRSPTKLGEYWACGLPAVAPEGIGDLDHLFSYYKNSGFIYEEASFNDKLEAVLFQDKERLRAYAKDYFDLDKGAHLYGNIYENLLNV